MAGWLPGPVVFESSRAFTCEGFETAADCEYYQHRWHFWYVADHVFALSTIAFFMSAIGLFIIGGIVSNISGHYGNFKHPLWRNTVAASRYLSYRGFHVKALQWNSAPLGLLLLGLAGTIYFFCMDLIPIPYYWPNLNWGNSPPLGTRSGWLSLACMPFVFATASKTNWITLLTGVSHEKLQIFHRWISYAFFVLALMHTFPFIVYHIDNGDMVEQFTQSNIFEYWTGVVALVFQAWLTIASFSYFRNLGYEFFKAAHFFSVIVFMLIFFWHCDGTLTSWHYFVATAAIYIPCLAFAWIRTLVEYRGSQDAELSVEDNGFTRIMVPTTVEWVPGQHCFLRFRGFGVNTLLSSHPFTICSSPSVAPGEESRMIFYLRHRGGFTKRLYDRATELPGSSIRVSMDGPYGGINLRQYYNSDRILVIAGGSGAGWSLPFIQQFIKLNTKTGTKEYDHDVESRGNGGPPHRTNRRNRLETIRVILVTRDTATRTWYHKTVTNILSRHSDSYSSSEIDVQVYLTGEAEQRSDSPKVLADLQSDSSGPEKGLSSPDDRSEDDVRQMKGMAGGERIGRPQLPSMIEEEGARALEAGRSLGIYVCGPLSMQNDVRNAVARQNLQILKRPVSGGVYLHVEHFSWA